jgi:hypothetical protein
MYVLGNLETRSLKSGMRTPSKSRSHAVHDEETFAADSRGPMFHEIWIMIFTPTYYANVK